MAEYFDHRGQIDYSSRRLPHRQQGAVWVFVTWRLADSVPQSKLARWKEEVTAWRALHPEPWDDPTAEEYGKRFSASFDAWLDHGFGSCLLRKASNRDIVADALHYFDGKRYCLRGFVIMPNHVHVLFSMLEGHQLPRKVQSWKRHSARQINTNESRSGNRLWQPDYYDRLIRSELHLSKVVEYIRENPKLLEEGEYTLFESEAFRHRG